MKQFIFQFVDAETGYRSEALTGGYEQLKQVLKMAEDHEKPGDKDYVLLIAMAEDNEAELEFSTSPLITVENMKKYLNSNEGVEAHG